jgi:hypothetical protein
MANKSAATPRHPAFCPGRTPVRLRGWGLGLRKPSRPAGPSPAFTGRTQDSICQSADHIEKGLALQETSTQDETDFGSVCFKLRDCQTAGWRSGVFQSTLSLPNPKKVQSAQQRQPIASPGGRSPPGRLPRAIACRVNAADRTAACGLVPRNGSKPSTHRTPSGPPLRAGRATDKRDEAGFRVA